MEDEHRRVIQNNFSSLVEQTDLDVMVTTLYEKGVFSDRMIEPYRDTNRDVRMRKRDLYMDITRRGPDAFKNLVDSLYELGYWELVRSLDPESPCPGPPRSPYPHRRSAGHNPELQSGNDRFVSLRDEKMKNIISKTSPVLPPEIPPVGQLEPSTEIPQFNVIKSNRFYGDEESDLKVYVTRGPKRGVLLVFNYTDYNYNIEKSREGANIDCSNLKYLFSEIGFKPLVFPNYSKKETMQKCKNLKESLVGYECLFVVVSSHGYERHNSSDTDFRCSDGGLISCRELITQFNNTNLPQLKGIPKVFIFQICRGNQDDQMSNESNVFVDAGPTRGGGDVREDTRGGDRWIPPTADATRPHPERAFSDILIAHSTLPGYVSRRDPKRGSWYIQVICDVFAARAHDSHVYKLLALADDELRCRFPHQTSSVDSWGFNRRLYLHPGLVEE